MTKTKYLSTYDELIDKLKQKAYNKAKERLGENEEFSVNYFIYNEGESYRVICMIETIKDISWRNNE